MNKALDEAVAVLGSQTAVARVCGVKQQNVWAWLNRQGGRVPPAFAPVIEAACRARNPESRVTREALCPDFPWGGSAPGAAG